MYHDVAAFLLVVSFPAIIIVEIRWRILSKIRLRELLPNEPDILRMPFLFDIVPQSVPDTENGRKFLAQRRQKLKKCLSSTA